MKRSAAKTTTEPLVPSAPKEAPKYKTFPLVLINWQDAAFPTSDGWNTVESFKPCLVAAQAAGFLVFDGMNEYDEEVVVLASALTFQPDGPPHFAEAFTVPKRMILNQKVIG